MSLYLLTRELRRERGQINPQERQKRAYVDRAHIPYEHANELFLQYVICSRETQGKERGGIIGAAIRALFSEQPLCGRKIEQFWLCVKK